MPLTDLCAQYPLPDDFNLGVEAPGMDPIVNAVAVQADGKILVGGRFTLLDGQTCLNLGRLNADGNLDSSFSPNADDEVYCLAVQADGRILVSGIFTSLGGKPCSYIGRLNADGKLDTTFNLGADSTAFAFALQPDDKILLGGYFTRLCGQTRNHIARLNMDGTLDATFNPGADGPPPPSVRSIAVQPDGKILVGGFFSMLGGQTRNCIGRLNADGTLDTNFQSSANSYVWSVAIQADGKILAGGYFTSLSGETRNHIGRFNSDGTLDAAFNPDCEDAVYSIALQTDGKIVLGGIFLTVGGEDRVGVGRVNADGSLDRSFDPKLGGVLCLAMQPDGKILVPRHVVNPWRYFLGRLNNSEPATQQLTSNGSELAWLRGGTSPEVWRSTFEYSTNGLEWVFVGEANRISGGWSVTNSYIPPKAVVRARGFVAQSSNWFTETFTTNSPTLDPPRLTCELGPNGQPTLIVYGQSGTRCFVQSRTNLASGDWTNMVADLPLTNTSTSIPLPPALGRQGFFRLHKFQSEN